MSVSGQGRLTALTEPQAGIGPIYQLITGAHSSVDLTMYELNDTTAEADLAADAARGVDVRVLLDQHLEKSRNSGRLQLPDRPPRPRPVGPGRHHLPPEDPHGRQRHLGHHDPQPRASDYPGTRDFAVIDTNRADVAAIVATFNADFAGQAVTPPDGTDLVWSPTNAEASVLSVITGPSTPSPWKTRRWTTRPSPRPRLRRQARRRRHHHHDRRLRMGPGVRPADPGRRARPPLRRQQPAPCTSTPRPSSPTPADPASGCWSDRRTSPPPASDYNRELGILTDNAADRRRLSATLATRLRRGRALRPAGRVRQVAGAKCTATATVYNAANDENNVTVHSNQPDKDATATAAGHSNTYKTDSSGYALIYLNGPPPAPASP